MGGKSRKKQPKAFGKALNKTLMDSIVASVKKLYGKHEPHIDKIREESEQNTVTVSFSSTIDCSEPEPKVTTKITYASRVTESITAVMDDPHQGRFAFTDGSEGGAEEEADPEAEDATDEAAEGG